jgi:phosphate transport system substrate-binding protein
MVGRLFTLPVLALIVCVAGLGCGGNSTTSALPPGAVQLHGAGATFPAPLYKKWREEYYKHRPEVVLSYQEVGSGEGVKQFLAEAVDFGASDAAMNDEEMASVKRGVQLVPMTAGAIVLAYNLEGLGGPLKLKRDVYVDIFLGRITRWDDPRIKETNPHLQLPSQEDIVIIARQDSSGTTFALTNHLSAVSPEWRDRGPGVGRKLDWPGSAMLAVGNEGVAGRIKVSKGSIGYIEYGFAERLGLPMAWLENKAGEFVQPHSSSGLATLMNTKLPDNLRAFFPDPEGKDSYPLVSYTWLLLYKKYDDPQKVAALRDYLKWCLTVGQEFSESLGYLPLPPHTATRATDALGNIS